MSGLLTLGRQSAVLGADGVFHGHDIAAAQRQMNALKPVTVSIARILLSRGQASIDQAIATAKGKWYESSIPGDKPRDKVSWAFDWHRRELAKEMDPAKVYAHGEDLKKFVMMAFIERNAADESRAWVAKNTFSRAVSESWNEMWDAIAEAIAALPAAIRKFISASVGGVTGIPLWGWGLIVLSLFSAVGYAAYKILLAAAPGASSAIAGRYLGVRGS